MFLTIATSVANVSAMLRGRSMFPLVLVLAGLVLASVVPAVAHQRPSALLPDAVSAGVSALAGATAEDIASSGAFVAAAPGSAQLPAALFFAAFLVALLVRRRARRAIGLALVVLLAVLAFENGLHSVHHGLDERRLAGCPLGAASSHLSATPVEDIATAELILSVVAAAPERTQPDVDIRALSAHQGRAPPSATA
jgi:fumarate reductase subunit D